MRIQKKQCNVNCRVFAQIVTSIFTYRNYHQRTLNADMYLSVERHHDPSSYSSFCLRTQQARRKEAPCLQTTTYANSILAHLTKTLL